jgi:hypothetical protein
MFMPKKDKFVYPSKDIYKKYLLQLYYSLKLKVIKMSINKKWIKIDVMQHTALHKNNC